jgi:CRISPR-associated protein Csb2
MIAFRVEYLTGVVRAADFGAGNDKSAPEWPPHPSRLFSALVSAWATAGRPEVGRQALQWLERQAPPAVHASEVQHHSLVTSYVPVNDDLALPASRQPRRFPAVVPDSNVVYMIWPDAGPGAEIRQSLEHLTSLIPSLGHSSSLVDVRLCDNVPPPTLTPADTGTMRLRVPGPGRLATLEALYEVGRRPDAGRWQLYGPVPTPRPHGSVGNFGEMFMFRLGHGIAPIPLAGTLRLCAAMRGAVIARADQPPVEVITGHAAGSTVDCPLPSLRPHIAFVPLADVGHRFARGHVTGVAAVLPRKLTQSDRLQCLRALGRVEELWLGPLGRFPLERQGTDTEQQALLSETWTRASMAWATVTPVVFGRFPDEPFGPEAQQMIVETCVRAGYPVPEAIELGPIAWVPGAPASHDYPARPEGPGRPKRFHVHARLSFLEPLAGPVIVGAGRYYGYGLCRPIGDSS